MSSVLELFDVTVAKDSQLVLEGVNLSLGKGEGVGLLGPSGAGKTTLLRVIAGLERPVKGRVLIKGRPATDGHRIIIPPEQRGVGMVFQNLALWPHMDVFTNIEFPLKARGISKEERRRIVSQLLEAVELTGHEHKYPVQLSGGQQQRVALARALVVEPEILLLDEPLSGLDHPLRSRILDLLERLHERHGFAFIYVSHEEEECRRISARLLYLEDGRLKEL